MHTKSESVRVKLELQLINSKKMELIHVFHKCTLLKIIRIFSHKAILKIIMFGSTIILYALCTQCEKKDRFYRPNLPEKLCTISIIDADDTTSNISFEKSFQSEYEDNDSLYGLSFSISSSSKELFIYQSDQVIKNLFGFKLPDSIEFNSGEKYFLSANEIGMPDISAEITVPVPPAEPTLISINKDTTTIYQFPECRRPFDDIVKYATIKISFPYDKKLYYAVLLGGTGINVSLPPGISGFLDFTIKESNVAGFFAAMPGLKMYHQICIDKRIDLEYAPVSAYFIDGSKISGSRCTLSLLVKFNDGYSLFDFFTSFRVKLLSIPRELYNFEKNLHLYQKMSKDPFSEPIYFSGNIRNGNGIFAICRSTALSIILPFPPAF